MLLELVVTAPRVSRDKRSRIETKSCLVNNTISHMAIGDLFLPKPKWVLSVVCLPIAQFVHRYSIRTIEQHP